MHLERVEASMQIKRHINKTFNKEKVPHNSLSLKLYLLLEIVESIYKEFTMVYILWYILLYGIFNNGTCVLNVTQRVPEGHSHVV